MSRSLEYAQGKRAAMKWAVTWLHDRANTMNDPHAKQVLNSAAFEMGIEIRDEKQRGESLAHGQQAQQEDGK